MSSFLENAMVSNQGFLKVEFLLPALNDDAKLQANEPQLLCIAGVSASYPSKPNVFSLLLPVHQE
jgi:hypothetical protein